MVSFALLVNVVEHLKYLPLRIDVPLGKCGHGLLTTVVIVAQLCLTLWDPMECSPPDSSVHGVLQARILE